MALKRSFAFLFLLLAAPIWAGSITGTVFDLGLKPVQGAVVELSSPDQRFVSVDGSFRFEVEDGVYAINARRVAHGVVTDFAEDNVTVVGDVRFDLILFPTLDDETPLLNESDVELGLAETEFPWAWAGVIAIASISFISWLVWKSGSNKKQKVASSSQPPISPATHSPSSTTLPADLQRLVDILRSSSGRITQKELRKLLPDSEAKVSLMLADLESRGVVRKIKKGRGNIITLV